MARNPEQDILKNPTPTAGASKQTVDAVLSALKIGNGFISLLSGLLAAVLILYSSYVLYDNLATENRAYASSWELLKYKPQITETGEASESVGELLEINKDYRAWLTIYDTTIDYPVVQGENDLYYASHDFYRKNSLTGAIYLAAGNRGNFVDSYNMLYGHHMDNGAMFGSLDRFRDRDYFNAHQNGIVVTSSGVYDITLFAAANTDAYENQIYATGNRAGEVISFLTGRREQDAGIGTQVVIYDQEAAQGAKRVIALSTCADAETNGRLVVFGKMTPRKTEPEAPEEPEDKPTEKPTEQPEPTPTETPTPSPKPSSSGSKQKDPEPTPEPTEESRTVTLTVHYLADGKEVFPTEVFHHTPGDSYYVVSPQYPGHTVDIEIVQGSITEDTTVYVHYTPKEYQVTVQYLTIDGEKMDETRTIKVKAGEEYRIYTKPIAGYTALKMRIAGINPGRDEEYTVIYVPDGNGIQLTTMEDYETALYLGTTCVQIGICFE